MNFIKINTNDIKLMSWLYWWDFCQMIPYSWKRFYRDKVRPIFAPQNVALRKVIPRTWADKTHLIPVWLYATVIDYVEAEKGLECWEYQDEEHIAKKQAPMLKEVYEFAKTGRDELIKAIDDAHPPLPKEGIVEYLNRTEKEPYEVMYAEVIKLEAKLDELDNKYLTWIVLNRELFWT